MVRARAPGLAASAHRRPDRAVGSLISAERRSLLRVYPHAVAVPFVTVSLALRVLLFALLFWTVVQGIRRQGVEGWLVLPVVVLRGINAFTAQLSFLPVQMYWFPFGVAIVPWHNLQPAGGSGDRPAAAAAAAPVGAAPAADGAGCEAGAGGAAGDPARGKLVLPGLPGLPGLTIESEYRPAREVGGDFFQIISHKTDGSVLIVAGDVSGKGLQAGMLVALLVGAIRSVARI